jgi:hypothetical protein
MPASLDAADDIDALPPADANPLEPATLAGTGLCIDDACMQISPDVTPYTPRWTLWADGATKRRWMYLPPGTQIDTTDMDHWNFPMGTKFWKEFTAPDSGGNPVRVETRYLAKVGPGDAVTDWFYVTYQWNATEDGATAVTSGVADANGTQHDIPSRVNCKSCHENLKPTRILGFGALQLDYTDPTAGEVDLAGAIANNWLSLPPTGSATPYFPLPSDGTTGATDALGYLHANCGQCHNPTSDVALSMDVPMNLRMTVGTLSSVSATPAYTTAVNIAATMPMAGLTLLVDPAMPDASLVVSRLESTNPAVQMPPIAVKMPDPTGDATLRTWIMNLPP